MLVQRKLWIFIDCHRDPLLIILLILLKTHVINNCNSLITGESAIGLLEQEPRTTESNLPLILENLVNKTKEFIL